MKADKLELKELKKRLYKIIDDPDTGGADKLEVAKLLKRLDAIPLDELKPLSNYNVRH